MKVHGVGWYESGFVSDSNDYTPAAIDGETRTIDTML